MFGNKPRPEKQNDDTGRDRDPPAPGAVPTDAEPAGPAGWSASEGADDAGGPAGDSLLERLQAERDQAHEKYLRTLADFQNYRRIALQNEEEARRQGLTRAVQAVVPVLDHFDLALAQDPRTASALQIVQGVRAIRNELIKVLEGQGIAIINPDPNAEFEPARHEAIMQQAGEGIEPGRIARTLQVGYALAGRVVRPAKVSVAPPSS